MYIRTSTPFAPFTFASEVKDGQTVIDPRDGVIRTVAGDLTGHPHDRVLITFRDGTVFLAWRHTPLDRVDLDQLHEDALAEEKRHQVIRNHMGRQDDITLSTTLGAQVGRPTWQRREILNALHDRALVAYLSDPMGAHEFGAEERDTLRSSARSMSDKFMSGQLADGAPSGWHRAVYLDELHARAEIEYRASAHADTRDRFRHTVRSYTLDDLHTIMLNNFGFGAVDTNGVYRSTMGGYRIAVVRDELHRRALVDHDCAPEGGGLTPEEAYAIECGNLWT